MSKSGVIILIIAAVVFTGLGFVIGQVVVAAGNNPGSEADPVVTQSYVDTLVGARVSELQTQVEELEALVASMGGTVSSTGNDPVVSGGEEETQYVKSNSDGLNVRDAASTGSVIASLNSGDEVEYVGSVTESDGVWYKIKLDDGTVGYVAGWLCSDPY